MPKNLYLDTATDGLYVTLTSHLVVFAPAERAETFSLFRLSLSLLCGGNSRNIGNTQSWALPIRVPTLETQDLNSRREGSNRRDSSHYRDAREETTVVRLNKNTSTPGPTAAQKRMYIRTEAVRHER
jgi:hypothetical protein